MKTMRRSAHSSPTAVVPAPPYTPSRQPPHDSSSIAGSMHCAVEGESTRKIVKCC